MVDSQAFAGMQGVPALPVVAHWLALHENQDVKENKTKNAKPKCAPEKFSDEVAREYAEVED